MKPKSNWLVSGIVGGLVFAAAVFVYRGTPTRPAYTRPAKRLVRIAPAVELATVLELGGRTGAAHEAYHDAVVGLGDLAVAALVRRLEREEVETLAGPFPGKVHEHVLAGAKRAEMAYFRTYVGADQAVASDDLPHLDAFEKVATLCAFRAKLYVDEGKVDEARELAEALLVFGDHILHDRVRYAGLLAGITVQELGLMSLALVYQTREDNEALDRLQEYADALGTMADRLDAKAAQTVLRLSMPTGDVAQAG